jgi:hypothetical protein
LHGFAPLLAASNGLYLYGRLAETSGGDKDESQEETTMKWTEADIQSLKAQEAKDLAVELLQKLQAKDKSPISAGEVQLKELQYTLHLKEAEAEDNRQREEHERKIKELELAIERERASFAQAARQADEVRAGHAALLEKVRASQESLSTQLERTTREHNLKVERLETEYAAKAEELGRQLETMEEQKSALQQEIADLTDLRELAEEVGRIREEIESRKKNSQHELAQLDEDFDAAAYDKSKRIKDLKRQQELDLAQLETQHKKDVMQENRKAAEEILGKLNMVAVPSDQWQRLQAAEQEDRERDAQELARIRAEAQSEIRKQLNITTSEVTDVTDLYYRHQAATREAEALRAQVEKLETEIRRMREHIEREPQRIAAAVEAAKVPVQNVIEQGGKR